MESINPYNIDNFDRNVQEKYSKGFEIVQFILGRTQNRIRGNILHEQQQS